MDWREEEYTTRRLGHEEDDSKQKRRSDLIKKLWGILGLSSAVLVASMYASSSTSGSSNSHLQESHRYLQEPEGEVVETKKEMVGGIFAEGLHLDQTKVGIMMASIIIVQLIMEAVLDHIETSVGASSRMLIAMIYKELATLGLISFTLFLVQSFSTDLNLDMLQAFEYSHVLVFGLAICYIVQSAVVIRSIKPIKRDLMKQNALANHSIAAVMKRQQKPKGNLNLNADFNLNSNKAEEDGSVRKEKEKVMRSLSFDDAGEVMRSLSFDDAGVRQLKEVEREVDREAGEEGGISTINPTISIKTTAVKMRTIRSELAKGEGEGQQASGAKRGGTTAPTKETIKSTTTFDGTTSNAEAEGAGGAKGSMLSTLKGMFLLGTIMGVQDTYWGFQFFRRKFIHLHHLPPSFLYDRYLIEIYNSWCVMKLEIASWCWAVVVGIFIIHIVVSMETHMSEVLLHPITFLICGWLIFVLDVCLFLVVHRAHQRVLQQLKKHEVSIGLSLAGRRRNSNGKRNGKGRSSSMTDLAKEEGELGGVKRSVSSREVERMIVHRQYSQQHNALEMIKRRRSELSLRSESRHSLTDSTNNNQSTANLATTTASGRTSSVSQFLRRASSLSISTSQHQLQQQAAAAAASRRGSANPLQIGLHTTKLHQHHHQGVLRHNFDSPKEVEIHTPPSLGTTESYDEEAHSETVSTVSPTVERETVQPIKAEQVGTADGRTMGGSQSNEGKKENTRPKYDHHHPFTLPTTSYGSVHGWGFEAWEWKTFDYGTQVMSILRCLYMAAFLVSYISIDIDDYKTPQTVILLIMTPLPAILSSIIIIPRMVTRFLLVKSLSSVNLNALDSVVEYTECMEEVFRDISAGPTPHPNKESFIYICIPTQYMECVEEAFRDISLLIQHLTSQQGGESVSSQTIEQIFQSFDTDHSGELSYSELRIALKLHGIDLRSKHFKALVRFVDTDQNETVDVEEFKSLLKGDTVFHMQGIGGSDDEEEEEEQEEEEVDRGINTDGSSSMLQRGGSSGYRAKKGGQEDDDDFLRMVRQKEEEEGEVDRQEGEGRRSDGGGGSSSTRKSKRLPTIHGSPLSGISSPSPSPSPPPLPPA